MGDNKNQMGRMSHFKNMFNSMRFKRAAGDNLDLGDRLVEKLAEQKHHMEAKIGNMTCVMRELNVLDASNNIDVQAMGRDIQKYTMPSEWFKNKYEHLLDTCYEMATNLPADIAENSVVTGDSFGTVKLGEVKMFTKCCEKAKTKLCMHQDIKKKVESNFGPMEDILQETQLTEHEFPSCYAAAARQGDGLHDRWDVSSLLSAGPTWPGAGLLRCSLSPTDPCNYQPSSMLATISNSARCKSILTKTKLKLRHLNMFKGLK